VINISEVGLANTEVSNEAAEMKLCQSSIYMSLPSAQTNSSLSLENGDTMGYTIHESNWQTSIDCSSAGQPVNA